MYTLGIDIGSTSSKTVILEDGKTIAAHVVIPLGTGTIGPQMALSEIFEQSGISKEQITYTVATGYGRLTCPEADAQISELSCHAKGIHFLLPQVDTIVDIGGQDAKALSISPQGKLIAFQMNDKCAAGTGRFLDVMARVLNVPIEQLGPLSETSEHPAVISNTCTVFAESEVINYIGEGKKREDIAAGVVDSVANKVAQLAMKKNLPEKVILTGGLSNSTYFTKILSQKLGQTVSPTEHGRYAGALGAALLAKEKKKR